MTIFNPGDIVRLRASRFVNAAGTTADPTSVRLRWRMYNIPTWTEWVYGVDAEIIKVSSGIYQADVPLTVAGRLLFNWNGTGAVTAAEGSSLLVHALPGDV